MSDTTAVNQAYFNKLAADYDSKFQKTLGKLEKELRSNADFIGIKEGGRLLDYACGTGVLSRSLGDGLSQCVGVDVSESMVEAYNAKARSQGFSADRRVAHVGNLVGASEAIPAALSGAAVSDFDAAGVGLGFHHFDDCALAARRLAQRLRPGGVLFIVDFVAHAADPAHGDANGVRHHGFTEAQIRDVFEGAGVGKGFAFRQMDEDIVFERAHGEGQNMVRRVFFARGEKA